ncbi:S-layer homology domain-containing protein [Trichothermofontia sichuanensis B231]|uniref:S-layer homology domain-containing protein n=1 Tax=Trichothermofontia sichuanensis TaxID=3045816 RepID=UPI002247C171|nr:S-layer homology domain-containing protein [Trichothermofontia sichuanensis]UZQ55449.1 S-layer homology domain-containing protein [Trichothermofontia sichuanensis B231]
MVVHRLTKGRMMRSLLGLGCFLGSVGLLSACANGPGSEALERALMADPQLQSGTSVSSPSPTAVAVPTLPADFPAAIPRYPQAELESVDPATGTTRWRSEATRDRIMRFYQEALQTNGWQLTETALAAGTLTAQQADGLTVTLILQPPTAGAAAGTRFELRYRRGTATTSPATPTSSSPGTSPLTSQDFSDLDQVPPSLRPAVTDLAALGVLTPIAPASATSPPTFAPNQPLTRRDFARWLVMANNRLFRDRPGKQIRLAQATDTPVFEDVPARDPDFAAIQGLAEAGILPSRLSGDSTATQFRPDAPLNRETLLRWKVPLDFRRTLAPATVEAVQETWGFQDASRISPDALRAVLADYQNGDLANIRRVFGFTTLLQPQQQVTRAEGAAALSYFGFQTEGVSAADVLQAEQLARSVNTSRQEAGTVPTGGASAPVMGPTLPHP